MNKTERDSNWDPIGDHLKDGPPSGDKTSSRRGVKIKMNKTERDSNWDPNGDHLTDGPPSGDKRCSKCEDYFLYKCPDNKPFDEGIGQKIESLPDSKVSCYKDSYG